MTMNNNYILLKEYLPSNTYANFASRVTICCCCCDCFMYNVEFNRIPVYGWQINLVVFLEVS